MAKKWAPLLQHNFTARFVYKRKGQWGKVPYMQAFIALYRIRIKENPLGLCSLSSPPPGAILKRIGSVPLDRSVDAALELDVEFPFIDLATNKGCWHQKNKNTKQDCANL